MTATPRVTVVTGEPRLCCPCGRGFLGSMPIESSINKHAGTATVTWYCKACTGLTSATFHLNTAAWSHSGAPSTQEAPF